MAMDNAGYFSTWAGAGGADGAGPDGECVSAADQSVNQSNAAAHNNDVIIHTHALTIFFFNSAYTANGRGLCECHGDAGERLPLHRVQHLL